jgi:hypothetical protein
MSSFVHFGCWNKNGCDGPYSNSDLTKVVDNLVQTQNNQHDFFVVAGDNYYAASVKHDTVEDKIVDVDELASGFTCLQKLTSKHHTPSNNNSKDINILMGNHDIVALKNVENDTRYYKKKDGTITPAEFPTDKCLIYDEQLKHASTFDFTSPARLLGTHTILLFINSSIIHTSSKKKDYSCGDNTNDQYDNIMKYYEQHLAGRHAPILNIIIIGHHPIFSSKLKNGSHKIQMFNSSGIDLIRRLYAAFTVDGRVPANYYLCADLHFYQTGHLTIIPQNGDPAIQINQVVSGTGGSELDNIVPPGGLAGFLPESDIRFNLVTYQSIRSHGYTIISDPLNNGQLNIEFKPVITQTGAGGRTQTRKQNKRITQRKSIKNKRFAQTKKKHKRQKKQLPVTSKKR